MDKNLPAKHIILVLSGKGGVGKSTVSAELALSLASQKNNNRVAILDVDLTGPSMPKILGLSQHKVHQGSNGWIPVYADMSSLSNTTNPIKIEDNNDTATNSVQTMMDIDSSTSTTLPSLSCMSIGFLLAGKDDPVVWRGPKKNGISPHIHIRSNHDYHIIPFNLPCLF